MFSTQSSHSGQYAQPTRRVSVIKNGFMEMLSVSSASSELPIAPVPLSSHAEVRQQQRGIRRDVLDCLVAYGRREHDHSHCEIVYFDSKAIERVKKEEGHQAAVLASDHRDVYAVIDSDGCVVTTGHRFRRILRDKSQSSFRASRRRSFRGYRARSFAAPFTTLASSGDWVSDAV